MMPTLPFLFNPVLELLARAIKQEKEMAGIQTGGEEESTSLLKDEHLCRKCCRIHKKKNPKNKKNCWN
jgi:hypothetical protein